MKIEKVCLQINCKNDKIGTKVLTESRPIGLFDHHVIVSSVCQQWRYLISFSISYMIIDADYKFAVGSQDKIIAERWAIMQIIIIIGIQSLFVPFVRLPALLCSCFVFLKSKKTPMLLKRNCSY